MRDVKSGRAGLRVGLVVVLFATALGCGGESEDGGLSPGVGVGELCIPASERQNQFSGFAVDEVSLDLGSPDCQTGLCLVNHFQGRVSCPYGQSQAEVDAWQELPGPDGYGTGRGGLCAIPGTNGDRDIDRITVPVAPQRQLRQSADAVYCSCRCANAEGATNDGATYCACPTGFDCVQLVDDIGLGSSAWAGGYCVRSGTEYFDAEAEASPPCTHRVFECDSSETAPEEDL